MKFDRSLDATDSMYPATSHIIDINNWGIHEHTTGASALMAHRGSSVYGYLIQGVITSERVMFRPGTVFAMSWEEWNSSQVSHDAKFWIVSRFGYRVPTTFTVPEAKGRLSYIDGCTDSMLVYPARKGDGSLNLLQFPRGIDQSWHTHPSIRLGYVLSGDGMACYHDDNGEETQCRLLVGTSFLLPEHSRHRFQTFDNEMRIIAYHPDGDWGPTDENHPMLNRTYLSDK